MDARKEIEALKAENLTLRNAIATMVVKDSATKGRKRGPQQLDDNEDIEITDARFLTKIEKCGRWCLVFRACYVDKSHFVGLDKEPKFGLGDRIRFLDDDEERDLCYGVKRANASRSGTSQNPQTPTPNQHQSQKHKSHVL